jgi:hypothetical protein
LKVIYVSQLDTIDSPATPIDSFYDTDHRPRCARCRRDYEDHKAKDLNCPMDAKGKARYQKHYIDNQFYQALVN